MVKSLVSKLSSASNLSIASTLSSMSASVHSAASGGGGVQETNYFKHRNDPGRFFGDGVQFKAKLIGILEVGEARGDRMCQEALQDLKMAIRAAGEHKQRITIHVTIDGLRLRDEKTSDSLYHHPVHKISFIAQDMTDSRAFGYIFGSPDSGHRFFGIKTDKAASQVVLAMRDLFQVVFELKKKEIELARQQIQSKSIHEHQTLSSLASLKSVMGHNDLSGSGVGGPSSLSMLSSLSAGAAGSNIKMGYNMDNKNTSTSNVKEMSPESVADLVDLEQELSSIQRGITQMERITPSEPTPTLGKSGNEEDPFGDSFTNFPTYNLLPPPESSRSRSKPNKPPDNNVTTTTANMSSAAPNVSTISSLLSSAPISNNSPSNLQQDDDDSWLNELDQQNDVFDTSKTGLMGLGVGMSTAPLAPSETTTTPTSQLLSGTNLDLPTTTAAMPVTSAPAVVTATTTITSDALSISSQPEQTQTSSAPAVKSDAFTDLDPLGTGRIRPYVDKKYFFQELKNPPKKVLKDLSITSMNSSSSNNNNGGNNIPLDVTSAVVDEFLQKVDLFDEKSSVAEMLASTAMAPTNANSTAASSAFEQCFQQQHQQQQLLSQQHPLHLPPPCSSSNIVTNTLTDSCPTAAAGSGTGLPTTGADPVMLPRDTDPFSPTRKKSDPFQEGDIFSNMDPFEFEFNATKDTATTQQKPPQQSQPQPHMHHSSPSATTEARKSADVFNGPLQVSLPPECGSMSPQTIETQWRQSDVLGGVVGMGNSTSISARSRPSPSSAQFQSASNASAAFKQQTADVISSISNKKMPHLFGQARFSKRDSNSINMRRLQESDSLSENETAPEPPPRPDSVSHAEPPPLPPKKQFSDIVIRPRIGSTSASASGSNRYEFLNSSSKTTSASGGRSAGNSDVPPIPLPSRRVGRSDGTYPGPGRPRKPGHTEDDYLAPLGATAAGPSGLQSDVPPLLPPPTQVSSRARNLRQLSQQAKSQDIYENKAEIMQQKTAEESAETSAAGPAAIIPDITLSQLLTLGIDELATKLNVPTSKLSTMTLVELTSYLSEFIEKSKPSQPQQSSQAPSVPNREQPNPEAPEAAIFKVNFDQEATFVAKFDDNFGEDDMTSAQHQSEPFVANFEQFNEPPVAVPPPPLQSKAAGQAPSVPPADRYAVFREIIDQELQQQQQDTDLLGDMLPEEEEMSAATNKVSSAMDASVEDASSPQFVANFSDDDNLLSEPPVPPKIDTKITEVVAQAKDRYAALRDIILVENLFDKKPTSQSQPAQQNLMQDFTEFGDDLNEDQDLKQIMENDRASSRGFPAEASSSALTVEDEDEDDEDDGAAESSLDSNEKDGRGRGELSQDQYKKLSTSNQQLDAEKPEKNGSAPSMKQDSKFLMVAGSSGLSSSKDDLEIDELMQRAISNLSLDSRERTSPAAAPTTGTPSADPTAAMATNRPKDSSPSLGAKSQFNDVSTSPIPLQKSPAPAAQQLPPTQGKSPQLSPIPTQLAAVSNLIDTASRQMSADQSPQSKESWATFESPKPAFVPPQVEKHRTQKRDRRRSKSPKGITLHLPPPPPSNASQNDTAESPCSSDARDDGWSKGGRRWPKQERGGGGGSNAPQTSSSSRDLSPWDDEAPDAYPKQRRGLPSQVGPGGQPISHTDRHGYYMRHARRMNSCDEDYDYDEDFNKRRDHRKFKQGISRSRDNFEFESSKWYHHPQHHTWSPQDEESSVAGSSRARSFDRSAYERTTYGPPIYDKRGVALPPPGTSSYDRRSGGYDKRKYYREYSRPNYDFDGYGEPPQERRGRRNDYENIYDVDSRSPMGYGKARAADYIYERDRKSFDRESVESFDSATRRRRSFGSGDVYGSLESREDFRERYMGGDPKATRSLRKSCVKMRTAGDIDYEDSDINEFQQQRGVRGSSMDTRSLQRPSQLGSVGSIGGVGSGQQRVRKSSGSSPWDGEEPVPHIGAAPGSQKSWKRPSSAAESERRLAESRRAAVLAQTPSGSDGEKDRRFRKKQRIRGKELPLGVSAAAVAAARYGSGTQNVAAHPRDNYDYGTYPNDGDEDIDDDDYVDEDYDEPPTDEDKFERLNRRRHEMHQRMLESERRQHSIGKPTTSALKSSVATKASGKYHGLQRPEFVEFDDFESTTTATPRSGGGGSGMSTATPQSMGASKFSFDDHGGFESDFNQSSPPPAPAGTASSCNSTPAVTASATTTPATKSSFRFSNDFSERDKLQQFGGHNSMSISSLQTFEIENQSATSPSSHVTPPITQKLRFDDNVKISKFDNDAHTAAFEDDFAKADFHFEKEDQWNADGLQVAATAKKNNLRNSKMQQRQELIKKSESINIFAKKSDDPFEDDEFFNAPNATIGEDGKIKGTADNDAGFQWDDDENNFAKFDENM